MWNPSQALRGVEVFGQGHLPALSGGARGDGVAEGGDMTKSRDDLIHMNPLAASDHYPRHGLCRVGWPCAITDDPEKVTCPTCLVQMEQIVKDALASWLGVDWGVGSDW